jgi:hypothetical protein
MLIFDENSQPIIIDSVNAPIVTTHIWVLDFTMMDFTLSPLSVIEETICPGIEIEILGYRFVVPSHWNILIYDKETSQLDVAEIKEILGMEFTAFIYGPKKGSHAGAPISVTNYFPEYKHISPSLNKFQMLCHPISSDSWVNISPSDSYNKYLRNMIVSDITGT